MNIMQQAKLNCMLNNLVQLINTKYNCINNNRPEQAQKYDIKVKLQIEKIQAYKKEIV